MEELLNLLKDGHARTTWMLANELHTTTDDINRKLEFMENMGIIKKVSLTASSCGGSCGSCGSCGSSGHCSSAAGPDGGNSKCMSCMPDAELLNMGEMWEVVV